MNDQTIKKPEEPVLSAEHVTELSEIEIFDLCDATDAAIEAGGGFGWTKLPSREILERYWRGVLAMPARMLFVTRLDGAICGTAQLICPPVNNEAQAHAVHLTSVFVAPWARKYGLSEMLLEEVETVAMHRDFSVINLDVRETMEAAISLFEKFGYRKIGTHPLYARIDGRYVQGAYYYKELNKKPPAET